MKAFSASGSAKGMNIKMVKNKNILNTDYLIIGNSAAGLSAAENIRKNDKNSPITVLTKEKYSNYSKPLTTYYLAGRLEPGNLYFKKSNFYEENNIDLKTNQNVVSIKSSDNLAITEQGNQYLYNKLLIASGGRPIIPEIRVIDKTGKTLSLDEAMSSVKGIFTLTTLDDAIMIRKYINEYSIKTASILGGGLIGLKAAEALLGLHLNINIVELSDKLLSASFDETASGILIEAIKKSGSSIYCGQTIEEIYTENNSINSFKLSNGRKIPSDLLILAVGVLPDTGYLKNSGIKTDAGIITDSRMKTSIDNIYAAGDIVKSHDVLSGSDKNMAIWPIAVKQGEVAGSNMSGIDTAYPGGFLMNSVEILGMPMISLGQSSIEYDDKNKDLKVYKSHDTDRKIYRKIVVRQNRAVGAILIGAIERAGIYWGLINNNVDVSEIGENIVKEDFGLIQLPADYRKHLVVGEGIEV